MPRPTDEQISEWCKLYIGALGAATRAMMDHLPVEDGPENETRRGKDILRFADLVADEVVRRQIRDDLGRA